jgi:hypothetical protein
LPVKVWKAVKQANEYVQQQFESRYENTIPRLRSAYENKKLLYYPDGCLFSRRNVGSL